jgi:Pyruvate/2-oxoacid:ferredoxin oxidoreductase delta subunit
MIIEFPANWSDLCTGHAEERIHSFKRTRLTSLRKKLTPDDLVRIRTWYKNEFGIDLRERYSYVLARMREHLMRVKAHYEQVLAQAIERREESERNFQWNPEEVLKLARECGALKAGFTDYHDPYFDRDMCCLVFSVKWDQEWFWVKNADPPPDSQIESTFTDYAETMEVANRVAERLLAQGIYCEPIPPVSLFGGTSDEFNFVPLAVKAGIGIVGKHFCILTNERGPRVKLGGAILYPPKYWMGPESDADIMKRFVVTKDFCTTCSACIKLCPPNAIATDDIMACTIYFTNNAGCGICIKVCPIGKVKS